MRKLIINADDYGLEESFNDGIRELIRKKIVTSVSVMVDREFFDARLITENSDISIGLHLEMKYDGSLSNIERQLEKFRQKFGKLPSHLDGHYHYHIRNGNISNIVKIAQKYNLPVRSRYANDRSLLRENSVRTPDEFISWRPDKINKLVEKLEVAQGDVIELVCHPGYFCKSRDFFYNSERHDEIEFLMSRKFRKIIKDFDLVNYHCL